MPRPSPVHSPRGLVWRIAPLAFAVWASAVGAAGAAGTGPTAGPGAAKASPPALRRWAGHVRGTNSASGNLLAQAEQRSATVAGLLATLEDSDVVVYVETGFLKCSGVLQFGAAIDGVRLLRVTLNVPSSEADLIAALAHELQHAVEIAGAPDIRDDVSMARYYEAVGHRTSGGGYCTREAQRVASLVAYEVAVSPAGSR